MNVIERIEELRNARGWSVNRLAMESGISQSTLCSVVERGASMKIDTLERICDGFGITLSQFFMDDERTEVVSAQEKIMLEFYRKLPDAKKKAAIVLLAD